MENWSDPKKDRLGFMVLTLQHRGNDWAAADLEVKVPPLGRREAHIANPS